MQIAVKSYRFCTLSRLEAYGVDLALYDTHWWDLNTLTEILMMAEVQNAAAWTKTEWTSALPIFVVYFICHGFENVPKF